MLRVVTSTQSAARDQSAITAGTPARALMQRAGAAAAAEIALRYHERLDEGVLVLAGPGNNGGDAWVVARALAATGVAVRVVEPVEARTADARAERALALEAISRDAIIAGVGAAGAGAGVGIVVDGLLGTGGRASVQGDLAEALQRGAEARAHGAACVALDIPSGIDASSGECAEMVLAADLTLTFATIKRGQLVNRDLCGAIVALDIGLGTHAELADDAPRLIDDAWATAALPRIGASAHKGDRRKLLIVGGQTGMAGAALLAARGALRSGIGMVKVAVADGSLRLIQETEPHALAGTWPSDDRATEQLVSWADAVVIGPGLGRGDDSRLLLDRVLRAWRGPTLLDADALSLFEGRRDALSTLLAGRPTLLTPHPLEFARVSGMPRDAVEAERFTIGRDVARAIGAVVLLKGVPTVITSPNGECLVSASGTPALATGGSGDVLSGIAGTLLAQTGDPLVAGALGAYVHGRAAERTAGVGGTRGITLEDVVAELRGSWDFDGSPTRYPVLAELPSVGR